MARDALFSLLILACSIGIGIEGRLALADGCRPTPYSAKEIQERQNLVAPMPVGSRIAYWAEQFRNLPYDTDPLGKYVRTRKIVCDQEMDCMYLVFRSVELALSKTPEGAVDKALDLRFKTKGKLDKDNNVLNYGERFDYAEDMIASGKWGKDITSEIAPTQEVPGSRGYKKVQYVPKAELMEEKYFSRLKDGDIIYFIKSPAKRAVGEIVGHMGIIKMEAEHGSGKPAPCLIAASGTKTTAKHCGGGLVKKIPLVDYLSSTSFIGAKFTR
ncbi:MAG: hypothetical protein WA666_11290, partial [Nitrospirota bacterium]